MKIIYCYSDGEDRESYSTLDSTILEDNPQTRKLLVDFFLKNVQEDGLDDPTPQSIQDFLNGITMPFDGCISKECYGLISNVTGKPMFRVEVVEPATNLPKNFYHYCIFED
jgi:hypothetical protein